MFDNDDDDEISTPNQSHIAKVTPQTKTKDSEKKQSLFDGEDSDDEKEFSGNFEIKQQFEGEKGERLRRLQDRFQGDSRFKMDSKFLEHDNDGEEGEHKEQKIIAKTSDDIETTENDERQWQLNILESVIGKKVQSNSAKQAQKK